MEQFRQGRVRANGLSFATLEAGDGPLVLCLHGFPDHARSFRHQLPALADIQTRISLSPISVRTLYFHGARDGCVGAELLDGMDQLFPQGLETVIVPEAGHFVHQERPEIVNRHLLEFLAPLR